MQSFENNFHQGQSFESFVELGEQDEIEAINELRGKITGEGFVTRSNLEKILFLSTSVNLLVVGEMFCPDCHVNIAAFHYLTCTQAKFNLSIVTRDYARKHLLAALELPEIKIPLVVLLDENYRLMPTDTKQNLFIERPKTVKAITNFDGIEAEYLAGDYLNDTLAEILDNLRGVSRPVKK